MKPHSERIKTQAVNLHDRGCSYGEIARRLGVAYQTVRRWIIPGERERHNQTRVECYYRKKGKKRPTAKHDVRRKSHARVMYRRGKSKSEIARRLGASRNTVRRWLDDNYREQYNEYIATYERNRRQTDAEFREKKRQSVRNARRQMRAEPVADTCHSNNWNGTAAACEGEHEGRIAAHRARIQKEMQSC